MSRPAPDEPTGTSLPEKPAPVQSNMPPQAGQQQQQHLQPLELPQPEPFRPSRAFTLGKLTLASFNFVFAIITLGLAVGLVTWSIEFESFIGAIIVAVVVSTDPEPRTHLGPQSPTLLFGICRLTIPPHRVPRPASR